MAEEINIDAKAFFKRTSSVLAQWKVGCHLNWAESFRV